MTPTLSICIPAYNGEGFLGRAIESALAQDFAGFELVIGDDGSTDRTVDLARSYRDARVRVLAFEENLGLAGNWNRTIQACRGAYIKYLAQDDLLCAGALQSFAEATTRFPNQGFFFCANEQIDGRGNHLRWRQPPSRPGVQSPSQLVAMLFVHGNQVGGPTNTLVRPEVFSEVGWFDPRCKYALDWVMWLQIAHRYGGVYLHDHLVRIREHEGSETRRLSKLDTTWDDGIEALRVLRQREPALHWWLNYARARQLAGLPRYAVRLMLVEGVLPLPALRHARNLLRGGLWYW